MKTSKLVDSENILTEGKDLLNTPVWGSGRSLLVIGAFCPPRGGPNAQRVGAIGEYLSQWKWKIDLYSLKTPSDHAIEGVMYQRLIAAGANINFIDENPQASVYPWRIDGEQPWAEEVVKVVLEKAAGGKVWDAVLATSPPFSALWAGYKISEALSIPLITDLQDPWSLAELWPFRSPIHLRFARRLHKQICLASSAIIMNCQQATKAVCEEFKIRESKIFTIENGFDSAEVSNVLPAKRSENDDRFLLVHIGTMMTEEGLREQGLLPVSAKERLSGLVKTSPAQTNTLAKSSYYLLHALRFGLDTNSEAASRIHIEFIGPWSEYDEQITNDLRLKDKITVLPFSTRSEAMSRCKAADAVVLPLHTRRDGKPIRIVPSKTYDYLASGKPILCLSEPCDAWSFIQDAERGINAKPDSPDRIMQSLEQLVKLGGSLAGSADIPQVARFDWPNLIARMSAIIDQVIPESAQKKPAKGGNE